MSLKWNVHTLKKVLSTMVMASMVLAGTAMASGFSIVPIGTIRTGTEFDSGAAEISAYDSETEQVFCYKFRDQSD